MTETWTEPQQKFIDAVKTGYESCGVKPTPGVTLERNGDRLCGCAIGAAAVGLGFEYDKVKYGSGILRACMSYVLTRIPGIFPNADNATGLIGAFDGFDTDARLPNTRVGTYLAEKYLKDQYQ